MTKSATFSKMTKLIICIVSTSFLLIFMPSMTESSKNETFLEFDPKNGAFDVENTDTKWNFSLKAGCTCKNGYCVEGKGCTCWPEFGKISDTECQACECGEGNNCTIETGWFKRTTCICKKGFVSKGGKCIDACPCKNGVCVEEEGVLVCKCGPGNGFIKSDGKCIACDCGTDSNCTFSYSGSIKKCVCKEGYKEQVSFKNRRCEGPCTNNPCENGGTCVDTAPGMYKCNCPEEFTGDKCGDIAKTPCTLNQCHNGGSCEVVGKTFSCNCTSLYFGKQCEKKVQTGCEYLGGDDECKKKGEYWTCINDKTEKPKYTCDCVPGYKKYKTQCVVKTGCEDLGGNDECKKKGKYWTCINDEIKKSNYTCDCEPGYKNYNSQCIVKTGCEDQGGNDECKKKGEYWTCVNYKSDRSKYICDCVTGYKRKNTQCVSKNIKEPEDESTLPATTEEPVDKSTLPETTEGKDPKDETTPSPTTEKPEDESTLPVTTEENCDCGNSSYACQRNKKGRKICSCFHGYAQLEDICSDCHCGKNTASCFFDGNGRNICVCRDGFALRNRTCFAMCESNADCLNGGSCSFDGYGSFCNCMPPYTGDRCETNKMCENMEHACLSIGAVCHYVHSIKQSFCVCPPSKTFNEDLNTCEDKFEFTSIFFITLCSATIFLLLAIVTIIVLLKRFRRKFDKI